MTAVALKVVKRNQQGNGIESRGGNRAYLLRRARKQLKLKNDKQTYTEI